MLSSTKENRIVQSLGTTYYCGICKTSPDQLSHHKSHLDTQKHKDKREVFELKLSIRTKTELLNDYNTSDITCILKKIETIIRDKKGQQLTEMELVQSINQRNNLTTNKDALREVIHDYHNYMRNNGAGYGMNALKVFNILYGLKKIEEYGLFEKTGLSNKCRFSYLLELANKNQGELLAETIIIDTLDSIAVVPVIRHMLFYEIPKNLKSYVFSFLIKGIENISKTEKELQVQLCGKIYEYFIGRDRSAISELGAYFTDRPITNYCFKKVVPELNKDGSLPSMIDMFGGSGGFTVGFISYMKEKYKNIDWSKNISKIHHYDMNEDVIKCASLEFFCLTGELPTIENLQPKNSFKDEFDDEKFHYIFTNPPYGGDTNGKGDVQNKRDKVKEYIKKEIKDLEPIKPRKSKTNSSVELTNQIINPVLESRKNQLKEIELEEKREKRDNEQKKVSLKSSSQRLQVFANKYNLEARDKEAVSLIMLMDMLEEGGTACGVLKEGVFFDSKYSGLRKCLIENYNVREIISIPQNQFENTATKTSILIFDNLPDKKTTEVIFRELKIDTVKEDVFEEIGGKIYLTQNAGEMAGDAYDVFLSSATFDELSVKWSLNGKDYGKKEVKVGEDFKLVKLVDICEFLPKSKRNASFGSSVGEYNFYSSSDKVKKCNIADYTNSEIIIIGTGGNSCIHYTITPFSCSTDTLIIQSRINSQYIYYSLISIWDLFTNIMKGSTIKHITKETFKNYEIPIPKSEEKMIEWVNKISQPYNERNLKQSRIKELETFVQTRIREISEGEECDEVEFDNILNFVNKKNKYKAGDGYNNGQYRFYTSSQDKVLFRNDYEFENKHILLGRGGVASIHISSKFSVSHDDVYVLDIKNKQDNLSYIYYYLKNNMNKIIESFKGSTIKHSSKRELIHIKLRIPKNTQFIQDLEPTFQEIETLQNEMKEAEVLYQKYIDDLREISILI